jgi:uncharacterized membrane protein YraQ (UPF0718 family)
LEVVELNTFLQLNSIFISILIEALPFIVIGVFMSAAIQVFVTEQMIVKILPKNRFLSVIGASLLGAIFPGCECGIVPVTKRLVEKGVPLYAGIAFMLTGPIINPVVLFSTYVAFGNDWSMVFYRFGLALIVSILVGIVLSLFYKDNQLLHDHNDHNHDHGHEQSLKNKIYSIFTHAIDEFFSVGKFLILGSFIASAMQTFVPTSVLLSLGQNKVTSILVMMGLAFLLSLCSEADAFIASSFRSTFSRSSLIAFLVFGAMVDIKNLLMMFGTFKPRFVMFVTFCIFVFVLIGALFI